ncbi:hypothetical protein D9M69_495030 [compost metagenome]
MHASGRAELHNLRAQPGTGDAGVTVVGLPEAGVLGGIQVRVALRPAAGPAEIEAGVGAQGGVGPEQCRRHAGVTALQLLDQVGAGQPGGGGGRSCCLLQRVQGPRRQAGTDQAPGRPGLLHTGFRPVADNGPGAVDHQHLGGALAIVQGQFTPVLCSTSQEIFQPGERLTSDQVAERDGFHAINVDGRGGAPVVDPALCHGLPHIQTKGCSMPGLSAACTNNSWV